MQQEQVDMVAGDFIGAAWRRMRGEDQQCVSTIEEASCKHQPATTGRPCTLVGSGGVQDEWSDVCGFIKPPGSETEWQIRMHRAFRSIARILATKPTDQSCHHDVWIHLLRVNAWQVMRERQSSTNTERQDWRPYAKKRPNPWDWL